MIYDAISILYDYMSITVYLRVLQSFAFMSYIVGFLYYSHISILHTLYFFLAGSWGVVIR